MLGVTSKFADGAELTGGMGGKHFFNFLFCAHRKGSTLYKGFAYGLSLQNNEMGL